MTIPFNSEFTTHHSLDRTDWDILRELHFDGRVSFAELGRRVNLSPPAVKERILKLEDSGIINGYRAEVNFPAIGLPITAFIQITVDGNRCPKIVELAEEMVEVVEYHRLTGVNCFMLKVVVPSMADIERIHDILNPYGQLTTAVVLTSTETHQPFKVEC
jgi:Lrp/AsnC family leucine-responsive transcriptional regulator